MSTAGYTCKTTPCKDIYVAKSEWATHINDFHKTNDKDALAARVDVAEQPNQQATQPDAPIPGVSFLELLGIIPENFSKTELKFYAVSGTVSDEQFARLIAIYERHVHCVNIMNRAQFVMGLMRAAFHTDGNDASFKATSFVVGVEGRDDVMVRIADVYTVWQSTPELVDQIPSARVIGRSLAPYMYKCLKDPSSTGGFSCYSHSRPSWGAKYDSTAWYAASSFFTYMNTGKWSSEEQNIFNLHKANLVQSDVQVAQTSQDRSIDPDGVKSAAAVRHMTHVKFLNSANNLSLGELVNARRLLMAPPDYRPASGTQ